MDYESFMDLVKTRRTHWHFRVDPVSDDYIEKIVDAARYAPSAFNSQLWEFVAIRDQGLRDEITSIIAAGAPPGVPPGARPSPPPASVGGAAKDPLGFRTAPVFILVLGDLRVRGFGPPHIQGDAEYWASASTTSLAAALEHMLLAATSLGLGSKLVSAASFPSNSPKIKELLGIPQDLRVYEMMAVGYSDFQPQPKQIRPLSEVLHLDKSGKEDFRSEEQIAAALGRR